MNGLLSFFGDYFTKQELLRTIKKLLPSSSSSSLSAGQSKNRDRHLFFTDKGAVSAAGAPLSFVDGCARWRNKRFHGPPGSGSSSFGWGKKPWFVRIRRLWVRQVLVALLCPLLSAGYYLLAKKVLGLGAVPLEVNGVSLLAASLVFVFYTFISSKKSCWKILGYPLALNKKQIFSMVFSVFIAQGAAALLALYCLKSVSPFVLVMIMQLIPMFVHVIRVMGKYGYVDSPSLLLAFMSVITAISLAVHDYSDFNHSIAMAVGFALAAAYLYAKNRIVRKQASEFLDQSIMPHLVLFNSRVIESCSSLLYR